MAVYPRVGLGQADASFAARLRQLDTDVTRLLRHVEHLQQSPLFHHGGEHDGAAGALQSATLTDDLTRTHPAAALIDGAGVTVHGDYWSGYGFGGDKIHVRFSRQSQLWYAVGAGSCYCVGALSANLVEGGSAQMSTPSGTITVYEQWGTTDSGATIGALWNEPAQRWEAALERC